MTTIEQIHRANMALLVAECGGTSALGDKIGASPSQVSQWLHGSKNSGTGKPRGMRPESSRKIEAACGKPVGWMDKSHAAAQADALEKSDAEDDGIEVAGNQERGHNDLQRALLDQAKLLMLYWSTDDEGRGNIIDAAQNEVDSAGADAARPDVTRKQS